MSASDASPAGDVTFMQGSTVLRVGTLDGAGQVSTNISLDLGSHAITARYAGDTYHASSTSASFTQVVTPIATATALAWSVNPSIVGTTATYTASVTANAPGTGTPLGTVTFWDGAAALGSTLLDGAGMGPSRRRFPSAATRSSTCTPATRALPGAPLPPSRSS